MFFVKMIHTFKLNEKKNPEIVYKLCISFKKMTNAHIIDTITILDNSLQIR